MEEVSILAKFSQNLSPQENTKWESPTNTAVPTSQLQPDSEHDSPPLSDTSREKNPKKQRRLESPVTSSSLDQPYMNELYEQNTPTTVETNQQQSMEMELPLISEEALRTVGSSLEEESTMSKEVKNRSLGPKQRKLLNGKFACNFCELSFMFSTQLMRHKWEEHPDRKDKVQTIIRKRKPQKEVVSREDEWEKKIEKQKNFLKTSASDQKESGPLERQEESAGLKDKVVRKVKVKTPKAVVKKYNTELVQRKLMFEKVTLPKLVPEDLRCQKCYLVFKSKAAVQKHDQKDHVEVLFRRCTVCHLEFPDEDALTVHLQQHLRQDSYYCAICNESFSTEATLQAHSRAHFKVKCVMCHSQFDSKAEFLEHCQEMHLKEHQCLICKEGFGTKAELEWDKSQHKSGPKYQCTICLKTFINQKFLEKHMELHGSEQQKDPLANQCRFCLKVFAKRSFLNAHISQHHSGNEQSEEIPVEPEEELKNEVLGKVRLDCDVCGKKFGNEYDLEVHLKAHLMEMSQEQPSKCYQCGKTFREVWVMTAHLQGFCSKNAH